MSGEGIGDEADLLVKKEQWAQSAADFITDERGIDPDTALTSARWASLWVDDFNDLMAERPPVTSAEAKAHIEAARATSLDRSTGISRYPTGVPTLRATIVAHDAFCLAFGDDAEKARQLLENQPELF